ncbi:hypothetical protein BDN70DRAFT_870672 [Pholiota conissans]|uniref:Paired domain-containing protein n=1 Tax=Pholiota conissans TaxID=109636 RepID=A0A9P5ZG36_9AGAR|nr:hypothetical protein BDN70DRAFT_870672 [Pholiota conissans]
MPAGDYCCVPGQQKQLVVRMSLRGMSTKDISIATGISARAVSWLMSQWKSTGHTVKHSIAIGRPRVLTPLDLAYTESLIEQRTDVFLSELQEALFIAHEVDIDNITISHVLYRRGYTRKKVSI